MNPTANTESDRIDPTVRAFRQLSPGSQGAVAELVKQLAEREGGRLNFRETSPRSPTPSLADPARLKVSHNFPMSPWSYFQLLQ